MSMHYQPPHSFEKAVSGGDRTRRIANNWKHDRVELEAEIICSVWRQVIGSRAKIAEEQGVQPYHVVPDSGQLEYLKSGDMHPGHSLRVIARSIQEFVQGAIKDTLVMVQEEKLAQYRDLLMNHPRPKPSTGEPEDMLGGGLNTALITMRGLLNVIPPCFIAFQCKQGTSLESARMPKVSELRQCGHSALDLAERLSALHIDQLMALFRTIRTAGVTPPLNDTASIVENFIDPFSADVFHIERFGNEFTLKTNTEVNHELARQFDTLRTGCPARRNVELQQGVANSKQHSAVTDLRNWIEALSDLHYYPRVAQWNQRW